MNAFDGKNGPQQRNAARLAPYRLDPASPWISYDRLAGVEDLRNRYFIVRSVECESYIRDNKAPGITKSKLAESPSDHGLDRLTVTAARLRCDGLLSERCVIVTSDSSTAVQTADTLRELAGCSEVVKTVDLAERQMECTQENPAGGDRRSIWERDFRNPWHCEPGFENVVSIIERTTSVIAGCEEAYQGRHIFLVTHCDPARILRQAMSGGDPRVHFQSPDLKFGQAEELLFNHAQRKYRESDDPHAETSHKRWSAFLHEGRGWRRKLYQLICSPRTHAMLLKHDLACRSHRHGVPGLNELTTSDPQVHVVFFSCAHHFEFLAAAAASLAMIDSMHIGQVFVYVDQKDPLTRPQQQILRSQLGDVIFASGDRSTGWGGRSILNQLRFFAEISPQLPSQDYIAKVDSDVMFFSDRVFRLVVESDADVYGHPFVNQYAPPLRHTYPQGGCYFFRNVLMNRAWIQPLMPVILRGGQKAAIPYPHCPEDAGFFELFRGLTSNIVLDDFFLPHHLIESFDPAKETWYSAVHFERIWVGDLRDRMTELFRKWESRVRDTDAVESSVA